MWLVIKCRSVFVLLFDHWEWRSLDLLANGKRPYSAEGFVTYNFIGYKYRSKTMLIQLHWKKKNIGYFLRDKGNVLSISRADSIVVCDSWIKTIYCNWNN